MTQTELTTARWELLNRSHNFSSDSESILLELLSKEIGYKHPDIGSVIGDAKPIASLPSLSGKAKIALCVGHARPNDRGAYAINGVDEETFNNERVIAVKQLLKEKGYDAYIINRYEGSSYGKAMRWLAQYLKRNDYTHAFEFHFNFASPSAKGFEYLFWHLSKKGVIMAKTFQRLHDVMIPGFYDRGIEPLGDDAHERGVLFTSLTHCPAIILEPFFGSNKKEVNFYMSSQGKQKLDMFYSEAIHQSIENLKVV